MISNLKRKEYMVKIVYVGESSGVGHQVAHLQSDAPNSPTVFVNNVQDVADHRRRTGRAD